MKEDGTKWVFIGAVDNPLLDMTDPLLLGLTIKNNYKIGSKSVVKTNPDENVGVFCKLNKEPSVIEYTELPTKMAKMVEKDGELKYGEANITCNLYSIEAIELASTEKLKYHYAFKKNSYLNKELKEVIPDSPNTYKFESFIFDAFKLFDNIAILRDRRQDCFAPIKNKEGIDSPKTAKELYEKYLERNKE